MAGKGTGKSRALIARLAAFLTGAGGWRDLALLAVFCAILAWSVFFVVRKPSGDVAAEARYMGILTVEVRDLPEAAWHAIRTGDRMGEAAEVTAVRRVQSPEGLRLHVELRVSGPILFVNDRAPFPPDSTGMRIGSLVHLQTGRWAFMGVVVDKRP